MLPSIIACMQDQEKGHLQQLQSLMPGYRARPSLLGPVAAAAGLSLGAAAGLLPTKLSHAITGMLCYFLTRAHCLHTCLSQSHAGSP